MATRSSSLATWLTTEAGIAPASRRDALLRILADNWVDDVNTLRRCFNGLASHIPPAEYQAVGLALERGGQPVVERVAPASLNRRVSTASTASNISDSLKQAEASRSHAKRVKQAPPGGRALPIKLGENGHHAERVHSRRNGPMYPVRETAPLHALAHERKVINLDGADSPKGKPNEAFQRQVKMYRRTLRRMYRCTIMPSSRFMRRWDTLLMFVLFFIATVTPFEVGFLNVELNALFYVNRIVDCVFFVDIFFNFFVAYRETTEKGGGWVFDNRRIAVHYVRTWFVVDLISALPTDTMLLILETSGVYSPNGIWRLLRLLRLLKLLRIFRLARIFTRWQASIGLSFAVASLLQFLVMTLLMAHWLASLWGFVGRNSGDGLLTEDAERDPLNQSWIEMAGLVELFGENSDTPVAGAFRLYGASLYVALSNIFGGSCELHPANYAEYYVQCLMMLVGSSVWAFVIGSGCGIIATLNPERIEYRQTMDQVNYFARSRKLPPQLSVRLRSFFQSTQHIFHAKRFDGLLEKMSGSLRADICSHVARKVLAKVPYFSEADVEADFLAAVALALKPRVYCPRELVRTDELVIVERGVIVRSSKIFVAGMCVGEDMIVKRETFRDSAPAIALAFVQVSTLGRSALDDLLLSFPLARARVRKAALRIATRRAFILAAQHLQKESPPSSTRTSPKKGAVLLAVAPMRIVKAEMQQESELNIEAAPGMPRRPLECCGTEERVRMIERRTDAMSRMQHDLEYKVDAIGRSMKQDMRQLTQMLAAAVGGPRFGKPAQPPAGAPAATENSATSSGTSGEHDLEA